MNGEGIPCMIGLPVCRFELAPVHTSSPRPSEVWLTMMEPKAAKGQGWPRARLACLIQWALVEKGMPLMVNSGLVMMGP